MEEVNEFWVIEFAGGWMTVYDDGDTASASDDETFFSLPGEALADAIEWLEAEPEDFQIVFEAESCLKFRRKE